MAINWQAASASFGSMQRVDMWCEGFFFSSRRRHTRLQGDWSSDVCSSDLRTRRRDKLSPDPTVRREILAAASTTLREHGVRGLSIAAVLERAALSTRAFYRHFEDRERGVEGKRGDIRGRRIHKKKKQTDVD